jgi:hypothetical protein
MIRQLARNAGDENFSPNGSVSNEGNTKIGSETMTNAYHEPYRFQ